MIFQVEGSVIEKKQVKVEISKDTERFLLGRLNLSPEEMMLLVKALRQRASGDRTAGERIIDESNLERKTMIRDVYDRTISSKVGFHLNPGTQDALQNTHVEKSNKYIAEEEKGPSLDVEKGIVEDIKLKREDFSSTVADRTPWVKAEEREERGVV